MHLPDSILAQLLDFASSAASGMHSKQFLSDAWPCVMWPHTASAAGWQAQISDGVDRWIPSFACGPAHTVAACRHRPLLHQQTHVHHTQSQILTSDQSPRPLAASPGNTQANADDAHHTGSRHHLMQSIVAPTPGHSTSPACQYQHEQAKKGSMGAPAAASARHTDCKCQRFANALGSRIDSAASAQSWQAARAWPNLALWFLGRAAAPQCRDK